MNREIKFRAWYAEKMFYTDKSDEKFSMMRNNEHDAWRYYPISLRLYVEVEPPEPDQITLMQFTGLQAADGTDIYEGDILWSKHWGYDPNSGKKVTHVVQWSKDHWFLSTPQHAPEYGWGGYVGGHPGIEVIGNIFETPGLEK